MTARCVATHVGTDISSRASRAGERRTTVDCVAAVDVCHRLAADPGPRRSVAPDGTDLPTDRRNAYIEPENSR
jgi:hypothetical protein